MAGKKNVEKIQVVGPSGQVLSLSPKIARGLLRDKDVREATAADIRKQPRPGQNLAKPKAAEAVPAETDLSKLKVAELEALAGERGVELAAGSLKADIVAALEAAAEGDGPDEPDESDEE